MATTLETLDLKMKTLMEAWNFKGYGQDVQSTLGQHGHGYPHVGERAGDWLVASIPQADGTIFRAGALDNPENRQIYDNFMYTVDNSGATRPDDNGNELGMFQWFFKLADNFIPMSRSLRSIYTSVFGNVTPNPTAQSAGAVSPNVFRQNDQGQKIDLGDYTFRRENQDNERDIYSRSKAILASSEDKPPEHQTHTNDPNPSYQMYS